MCGAYFLNVTKIGNFDFKFFGQTLTNLYININGNVTFNESDETFSSEDLGTYSKKMIAPFWSDIDLGGAFLNGGIYYKFESSDPTYPSNPNAKPTRLKIVWYNVGYYNEQNNKRATFQLILTNGLDGYLPNGNNVCIYYEKLEFTTGSASCSGITKCDNYPCGGSNGFGGFPATVGVTYGDRKNFYQVGRFDHIGTDFSGPSYPVQTVNGNQCYRFDGVDWLVNNCSFNFDFSKTLTVTPSPCANNLYDIDVSLFTAGLPTTGTMTGYYDNQVIETITLPLTAPLRKKYTGFSADGLQHTVKFTFSNSATIVSNTVTAPNICSINISVTTTGNCVGGATSFAETVTPSAVTFLWNFGDPASGSSNTSTASHPTHTYSVAGNYTATLTATAISGGATKTVNIPIEITTCQPPFDCAECVPSFSPIPNEKYLVGGWMKEDFTNKYPDTYIHGGIQITFLDANHNPIGSGAQLFLPSGPIIDGWQRIEDEVTVPSNAASVDIALVNIGNAVSVYFDDIRFHPFKSNMKSYVYNPSTQKLTAELDENNYATFYEYDDEGILIRIKKETERGVMTIKETRNNQSKLNK